FAHEIGHVAHRHMAWYVVLFGILLLISAGPGAVMQNWLARGTSDRVRQSLDLLSEVATLFGFVVLFGFVSRRFERQADVYAARTIESIKLAQTLAQAPPPAPAHEVAGSTYVGAYGAGMFNSA